MTELAKEPQENIHFLQTVLSFLTALNNEDFEAVSGFITEDLHFSGVLGSHDGAKAFLKDMRKLKIKYKVHKLMAKGGNVCTICDYQLADDVLLCFGLYHFDNGRINSIKIVFDSNLVL